MQELYLLTIVFLSSCLYYMLKNRLAIFFPSFPGMIRIIEEFADAGTEDVAYDLGSGDGRVVEAFAKRGFRCVGIEQNPFLNIIARKRLGSWRNARIVQGNIFDQDLSKATVIIAYLSKPVTKNLQRKVEKECRKGTKIILVSYKFDDWKPVRIGRCMWIRIRLYVKK